MAGKYGGYYDREGKGKRKRYKCSFCNHKLPTYEGICSHLERTHDGEIEENERRAREWKENQQRKKREEIEQEREDKEFAEIQLEEYRRMLPQIKEQNRLKKEAEQRRIERLRKICNAMIKEAYENGSYTNARQIYFDSLIGKI